MKTQSIDTHLEIERVQFEALRRMTPREKLEAVTRLNRRAILFASAGLRRLYPNASDEEVAMRLVARRIGVDLVKRLYGWDFTAEQR